VESSELPVWTAESGRSRDLFILAAGRTIVNVPTESGSDRHKCRRILVRAHNTLRALPIFKGDAPL
jgi:hypothetical protein